MVLSIGTDGDASYYLKHMAEYYTGGSEPVGTWYTPYGQFDLQNGAKIDAAAFNNLMEGFDPEGATKIGQDPKNKNLTRTSSYDLTFSCPKSVSIMWALSNPQTRARIERIVQDSVRRTLETAQEHTAFSRRGHNGMMLEKTTMFGALFQHGDARPMQNAAGDVLSDMNLHYHSVIFNLTQDNGGKWWSLDAKHILDWKMALGATHHAELAQLLEKEFGCRVKTKGRNGEFEISGIPDELIERFSRRRNLIKESLKAYGLTSADAPELAAAITRTSREAKPAADASERATARFDRWAREAAEAGYTAEEVLASLTFNILSEGERQAREVLFVEAMKAVAFTATETKGVIALSDIHRHIAAICSGHGRGADDVEALVKQNVDGAILPMDLLEWDDARFDAFIKARVDVGKLVALPNLTDKAGRPLFTSPDLIRAERGIWKLVDKVAADRRHVVPYDKVESYLADLRAKSAAWKPGDPRILLPTEEQEHLIRFGTTEPGLVASLEGAAGAGKSTVLKLITHAYRNILGPALGVEYRVLGASAKWLTTKAMIKDADLVDDDTRAAAKWIADIRSGKETIDERTVLLVDEAGQMGSRDLYDLLKPFTDAGAKVILTGDRAQQRSVGAGPAMDIVASRIGSLRLERTQRMQPRADDIILHREGVSREEAIVRAYGLSAEQKRIAIKGATHVVKHEVRARFTDPHYTLTPEDVLIWSRGMAPMDAVREAAAMSDYKLGRLIYDEGEAARDAARAWAADPTAPATAPQVFHYLYGQRWSVAHQRASLLSSEQTARLLHGDMEATFKAVLAWAESDAVPTAADVTVWLDGVDRRVAATAAPVPTPERCLEAKRAARAWARRGSPQPKAEDCLHWVDGLSWTDAIARVDGMTADQRASLVAAPNDHGLTEDQRRAVAVADGWARSPMEFISAADVLVHVFGLGREEAEVRAGNLSAEQGRKLVERHYREVRDDGQIWLRQAATDFSYGPADPGLAMRAMQAYEAHGRLKWSQSHEDSLVAAVEDWKRFIVANPTAPAIVLAKSNSDIRDLNALMRGYLRERGEIGEDVLTLATVGRERVGSQRVEVDIPIAVGERLMFTTRNAALDVVNGTLGRVTAVSRSPTHGHAILTMLLGGGEAPEREITFDTADCVDKDTGRTTLEHSYAVTTFSAQGMTKAACFAQVDSSMKSNSVYVAASRARALTILYASRLTEDVYLAANVPLTERKTTHFNDRERLRSIAYNIAQEQKQPSVLDAFDKDWRDRINPAHAEGYYDPVDLHWRRTAGEDASMSVEALEALRAAQAPSEADPNDLLAVLGEGLADIRSPDWLEEDFAASLASIDESAYVHQGDLFEDHDPPPLPQLPPLPPPVPIRRSGVTASPTLQPPMPSTSLPATVDGPPRFLRAKPPALAGRSSAAESVGLRSASISSPVLDIPQLDPLPTGGLSTYIPHIPATPQNRSWRDAGTPVEWLGSSLSFRSATLASGANIGGQMPDDQTTSNVRIPRSTLSSIGDRERAERREERKRDFAERDAWERKLCEDEYKEIETGGIDLRDVLREYGFQPVKADNPNTWCQWTRGSTDKVDSADTVSIRKFSDGWGWEAKDASRKGSGIKSLGIHYGLFKLTGQDYFITWKELRKHLPGAPSLDARPKTAAEQEADRLRRDEARKANEARSEAARREAEIKTEAAISQTHTNAAKAWSRFLIPANMSTDNYLVGRGISRATLYKYAETVRFDPKAGCAVFKHTKLDGAITGYERKPGGPENKIFSTGTGGKSLAVFGNPAAALKRIVLIETGVDALSVAQLDGAPDDALYISTGGNSNSTLDNDARGSGTHFPAEYLMTLSARHPGAVFELATDRDQGGFDQAKGWATLLASHPGGAVRRITLFTNDWNNELRLGIGAMLTADSYRKDLRKAVPALPPPPPSRPDLMPHWQAFEAARPDLPKVIEAIARGANAWDEPTASISPGAWAAVSNAIPRALWDDIHQGIGADLPLAAAIDAAVARHLPRFDAWQGQHVYLDRLQASLYQNLGCADAAGRTLDHRRFKETGARDYLIAIRDAIQFEGASLSDAIRAGIERIDAKDTETRTKPYLEQPPDRSNARDLLLGMRRSIDSHPDQYAYSTGAIEAHPVLANLSVFSAALKAVPRPLPDPSAWVPPVGPAGERQLFETLSRNSAAPPAVPPAVVAPETPPRARSEGGPGAPFVPPTVADPAPVPSQSSSSPASFEDIPPPDGENGDTLDLDEHEALHGGPAEMGIEADEPSPHEHVELVSDTPFATEAGVAAELRRRADMAAGVSSQAPLTAEDVADPIPSPEPPPKDAAMVDVSPDAVVEQHQREREDAELLLRAAEAQDAARVKELDDEERANRTAADESARRRVRAEDVRNRERGLLSPEGTPAPKLSKDGRPATLGEEFNPDTAPDKQKPGYLKELCDWYQASLSAKYADEINFSRIRPGAGWSGEVVIDFKDGSRLRDDGRNLMLNDRGTPQKAALMIEIAAAKGLTELRLKGPLEFKKDLAKACYEHGITVVNPELRRFMASLAEAMPERAGMYRKETERALESPTSASSSLPTPTPTPTPTPQPSQPATQPEPAPSLSAASSFAEGSAEVAGATLAASLNTAEEPSASGAQTSENSLPPAFTPAEEPAAMPDTRQPAAQDFPQVTLTWRNEGFGGLPTNAVAFRYDTADTDLTDAQQDRLLETFSRHGFVFNETRSAWINRASRVPSDAAVALHDDMAAQGIPTEHDGAVPDLVLSHIGADAINYDGDYRPGEYDAEERAELNRERAEIKWAEDNGIAEVEQREAIELRAFVAAVNGVPLSGAVKAARDAGVTTSSDHYRDLLAEAKAQDLIRTSEHRFSHYSAASPYFNETPRSQEAELRASDLAASAAALTGAVPLPDLAQTEGALGSAIGGGESSSSRGGMSEAAFERYAELTKAQSPYDRLRIARHPETLPALLDVLSHDPDESVRAAVARNPFSPQEATERLMMDPSPQVRDLAQKTDHVWQHPGAADWSEVAIDLPGAASRSSPSDIVVQVSQFTQPLAAQIDNTAQMYGAVESPVLRAALAGRLYTLVKDGEVSVHQVDRHLSSLNETKTAEVVAEAATKRARAEVTTICMATFAHPPSVAQALLSLKDTDRAVWAETPPKGETFGAIRSGDGDPAARVEAFEQALRKWGGAIRAEMTARDRVSVLSQVGLDDPAYKGASEIHAATRQLIPWAGLELMSGGNPIITSAGNTDLDAGLAMLRLAADPGAMGLSRDDVAALQDPTDRGVLTTWLDLNEMTGRLADRTAHGALPTATFGDQISTFMEAKRVQDFAQSAAQRGNDGGSLALVSAALAAQVRANEIATEAALAVIKSPELAAKVDAATMSDIRTHIAGPPQPTQAVLPQQAMQEPEHEPDRGPSFSM